MSTIFEKIIAREVPAFIIYEDDKIISFLDINPVNKGHALVVPKKKFINIFDADEEILGHMMCVAKNISLVIKKETGATGINLVMNNGEDAGQDVFHSHLHIIPRHKNDDVFQMPSHASYEDGEAQKLADKLKIEIE